MSSDYYEKNKREIEQLKQIRNLHLKVHEDLALTTLYDATRVVKGQEKEKGILKYYRCPEMKYLHMALSEQDEILRFRNIVKMIHEWKSWPAHPNILKLYRTGHYRGVPYVFMEKFGADLMNVMDVDVLIGNERFIFECLRQVCDALEFLNQRSLVHLDLKPENILVEHELDETEQKFIKATFKLIDFDTCRLVQEDPSKFYSAGTTDFLSPESLVKEKHITFAVDIWALGLILVEIIFNKSLWKVLDKYPLVYESSNNLSPSQISQHYKSEKREDLFLFPTKNISEDLVDLIHQMIQINPKNRLTIPQIRAHPFYQRMEKTKDDNMEIA